MKKLLGIFALALALPAAAFAQSFSATLGGASEVPGPGDTDGVGFAVVSISGTTINYTILAQNIGTPTLAHIHTGGAGTSGAVLVDFTPSFIGGTAVGSVTTTQENINKIAGNPAGFYVNVHTNDFPNGAIRGQLAAPVSEGGQSSYLPIVGKAQGANNTNFVTDLRIINLGGATANVTLAFFAASAAGQSTPTVTKTITVAPNEQKILDDVVGVTLATTGLGALKVTSDQNVVVTSRVINDLRASSLGTTGFSVDGQSVEEAKTSGTIPFLSQASSADIGTFTGFRTNVGYFNPSSTPVTATFTARRTSDGTILGTSTATIAGFSQLQQAAFTLVAGVPDADRVQSNFYITWTSSAPLFVYGSVVDNKTGDSVLIQ